MPVNPALYPLKLLPNPTSTGCPPAGPKRKFLVPVHPVKKRYLFPLYKLTDIVPVKYKDAPFGATVVALEKIFLYVVEFPSAS